MPYGITKSKIDKIKKYCDSLNDVVHASVTVVFNSDGGKTIDASVLFSPTDEEVDKELSKISNNIKQMAADLKLGCTCSVSIDIA